MLFPFTAAPTRPLVSLLGAPLLLLVAASSSRAQTPAVGAAPALDEGAASVERLIELGRTDNRVQEHLDYLTNHIGHRLTGSPNLERACRWARARFEAFGLEAHIEQWGSFPVGFDARDQEGGMVAPERVEYLFRTPAWTPGTAGPRRGQAVIAPRTEEELEAVRELLPGCWLVHAGGRGKTKSIRDAINAAIETAGIAGEVKNGGQAIQVFGDQRVDPDDLPQRVSVRLQTEQFEDLVERLGAGQEVELEFDVDNRFLPGPFPCHNVIADIPGSEFPDEYVVVGGHIDSWHAATGTNDNGTGVATTLEAARLLVAAGAKPRRTIRFMLWGGEEQGLLGSKGYVEAHPDILPRISAVLVHDGGTNYLSGISAPPAVARDLERVFAPVLELDPEMPFEVRENRGLRRAGGSSDHGSFLQKGVPGFFWSQSGRTRYGDFWHTHRDTFDSAVPEYQRHSALVIAVGALGIANLDHLLEREGLFSEESGRRSPDPTRRRMGVYLDGNQVQAVMEDSLAEAAGWQEGDLILSIDGVEVDGQREIVRELQEGGPVKTFQLKRGEELVESVLDYTGSPSEKAREERARAQKEAEEQAAQEGSGG